VKPEILLQEIRYKAVRSGGAGGQHVNKVSTKIELTFELDESEGLTEKEKERLRIKLVNQLTKENVLIMKCDESRSQLKNRNIITKRFLELIKKSLIVPKKRKKTKPSKEAKENRLKEKKRAAQKKANRSKPRLDD